MSISNSFFSECGKVALLREKRGASPSMSVTCEYKKKKKIEEIIIISVLKYIDK
jgi:hypothetical protein